MLSCVEQGREWLSPENKQTRENKEWKIYNMIIIGCWMHKDILIMESGGKGRMFIVLSQGSTDEASSIIDSVYLSH